MMTPKELRDNGWTFVRIKFCCGGQKNEIWTRGEYELRIRPIARIFIVKHRGNSITAFLRLEELKTKLNELEILEKAPD